MREVHAGCLRRLFLRFDLLCNVRNHRCRVLVGELLQACGDDVQMLLGEFDVHGLGVVRNAAGNACDLD